MLIILGLKRFSLQTSTNGNVTKPYFCQDGQYNDMATLFFTSQESAIRQLFHLDGKLNMFFDIVSASN